MTLHNEFVLFVNRPHIYITQILYRLVWDCKPKVQFETKCVHRSQRNQTKLDFIIASTGVFLEKEIYYSASLCFTELITWSLLSICSNRLLYLCPVTAEKSHFDLNSNDCTWDFNSLLCMRCKKPYWQNLQFTLHGSHFNCQSNLIQVICVTTVITVHTGWTI